MLRTFLFVSLCCYFASSCIFQNMAPEEHLKDAVTLMNDDLRWMRVRAAATHVDPRYAPRFSTLHRGWGSEKQIADTEVVGVVYDRENKTAESTVTFAWFRQGYTYIRQTQVVQKWRKQGRGFVMVSTRVIGGDSRLLDPGQGESKVQPMQQL